MSRSDINKGRSLCRVPLFDIVFAAVNQRAPQLHVPGIQAALPPRDNYQWF
jgi:hypothetical protein